MATQKETPLEVESRRKFCLQTVTVSYTIVDKDGKVVKHVTSVTGVRTTVTPVLAYEAID